MPMVNSSVQFLSHFWFMHTLLCWQLGIQLLIIIPARAVPVSLILPHFRLDYFGFVLPHAAGLDPTKSCDWFWCSMFSASLSTQSQGTLVCHCSSTESIFNCLDPTHKHTLRAGNEAEHYVMHIQNLKQSLGVSSNFLFSLFCLPQPFPVQSVTAALHQCNLVK